MPDVVTIPERLAGTYLRAVLSGADGTEWSLVKHRQTQPGAFIVLAQRGDTARYATWYVGDHGAVDGHYFDARDAAEQDFLNRP